MMKIAQLTPDIAVGSQPTLSDLEQLAAAGIRSFINNRPDNEAPDQPRSADLARVAQHLGIEYRHVPVVTGQQLPEDVEAFAAALEASPKPVLAFCRTGNRSTTLWALASAPNHDAETILSAAKAAGYDLSALRPRIEGRLK
jgi:uncharacterized protein (TIGR01244 family)